jgi:hypothetical protein
MANHPNRRMPRVQLSATVFKVPEPGEIPALLARIARLWAELHEYDRDLALVVARSLPRMEIRR